MSVESVLPENMPRGGNRFTRWLGRKMLQCSGWRIRGEIPNEKKLMVAAAPHTSNWDFVTAMMAVLAMGLKFSFLMKKEAFFWPFKDLFMGLGGIPTDRKAQQGVVNQVARWYRTHETCWVAITPEGTRSKVGKWKSGFVRIAYEAKVPILLVAWDYPSKSIVMSKVIRSEGNFDKECQECREYMTSNYTGRRPENQ